MLTMHEYHMILADLGEKEIFSQPIRTILDVPPKKESLFLKHDVEARVDLALEVAQIEAATRHFSTFYFQGDLINSRAGQDAARSIAALGHEVSYHFDVLDAHEGILDDALKEYEAYCEKFEGLGCPVQTVCPHGNPTKVRSGWKSNKDFFRSEKVRKRHPNVIDIVIDFPSKFPNGVYVSDAGLKLRTIQNISGNDISNKDAMADGIEIDFDSLSDAIMYSEGLVLSLHPHRFRKSKASLFIQKQTLNLLKRVYMVVHNVPFTKMFASRFYRFVRKF